MRLVKAARSATLKKSASKVERAPGVRCRTGDVVQLCPLVTISGAGLQRTSPPRGIIECGIALPLCRGFRAGVEDSPCGRISIGGGKRAAGFDEKRRSAGAGPADCYERAAHAVVKLDVGKGDARHIRTQ